MNSLSESMNLSFWLVDPATALSGLKAANLSRFINSFLMVARHIDLHATLDLGKNGWSNEVTILVDILSPEWRLAAQNSATLVRESPNFYQKFQTLLNNQTTKDTTKLTGFKQPFSLRATERHLDLFPEAWQSKATFLQDKARLAR